MLASVFTAYLHSSRGDVPSFARKNFIFGGFSNFIFAGFSTVFFFRVASSDGVLRLSVSGKTRFLPASQMICTFGSFIRISLKSKNSVVWT